MSELLQLAITQASELAARSANVDENEWMRTEESRSRGPDRRRGYAYERIAATGSGGEGSQDERRLTSRRMKNREFSTNSHPLSVRFAYRASVLRKFVLVTGALDIPIGLATIAAALIEPRDAHFGALMTCGAFLMFAGAALVWSTADLEARAPIVFWQGFVRLTAVGSILYMVPAGLAESWQYAVVAFDGVIAAVYIVGTMQLPGASFFGLLMGKGGE